MQIQKLLEMDLIENLLRQKYLLPDEEIFEPATSKMRHLLATQIMFEVAYSSEEIKVVNNELLKRFRNKLEELNVKSYRGELNGQSAIFYKVVDKE